MNNTATKLEYNELNFSISEEKIQKLKQDCDKFRIVGQDRAIQALELGLGVNGEGYNIFIMGSPGTGRKTVLSSLLKDYKPEQKKIQDIAYAYNFSRPLEPQALFFPIGKARNFKNTLKSAVENIHERTLLLLKSQAFLAEQKKIFSKNNVTEQKLLSEFESKMQDAGFKMIDLKDENGQSVDLVPIIDGKEINFNELHSMMIKGEVSEKDFNNLREQYYTCLDEMSDLFFILKNNQIETEKELAESQKNAIIPIVKEEIEAVKNLVKSYEEETLSKKEENDLKKIFKFVTKVEEDLINRSNKYNAEFKSAKAKKVFLGRYIINIISEHSQKKKYVVQENTPSFTNLFGTIESASDSAMPETNGHLRIRNGAVHRAFGGYLVLQFRDLIEEEDSWVYLKRILQSGKIEIHSPPSGNQIPTKYKPQALDANFKVIIIGGEYTYDLLYQEDPDFYKLFKVCAEFDSVMKNNDANIKAFINVVNHLCKKRHTLPLTNSGYARLVAYASNIAESHNHLTTKFTKIANLIVEADFNARKQNKKEICSSILNQTIEKRHYLHSLPEEKFTELIQQGDILISVSGKEIAKINGLAVEERGYHSFGVPVAVTAQASPGNSGIVNIEREAGLSGEIYDKAHLIITSLLRQKFAKAFPLSISASVCFEQSYSYIDGDSASCAEFLALISAIGDFPMRQDIAVTGSLNQLGMVQPVGGISEKIEGFFNTCKILGFTGTQGVMIPYSNKNNLFLSKEILEACENNMFNIWVIKNIDEGILLLSGLEEETYTRKVSHNLEKFYHLVKKL